jgi:hypothetical protein
MSDTYIRAIPRDLFNEANLLKCLGQLYIQLELKAGAREWGLQHTGDRFEIEQDDSDGSLAVANFWLTFENKVWFFYRPLNSREPYPLYTDHNDTAIAVFDHHGTLTEEFLKLIRNPNG